MIWRQSSGIAKALGDLDALVKGCLPRTPDSIAIFVESHNDRNPDIAENQNKESNGEPPKSEEDAEGVEAVSVAKALIKRIVSGMLHQTKNNIPS